MFKLASIRLIIITIYICVVSCRQIIPFTSGGTVREERLHAKYAVRWEPDFDNATIVFRVSVETTGFIGFGFSQNGGMEGGDIVIGGVHSNGTSYFKDYHSVSNSAPIVDESQDWHLISFLENATHTELEFSRAFDTCDENDVRITNDSTSFIWSFGASDDIAYHGVNRGQANVNVLDPPMPQLDLSRFENWTVSKNYSMSSNDTSYWCSMHKRPRFKGKRFVVGFDVYTPSPEAVKHSHHISISKCITPKGQDPHDLFGSYLEYAGEECHERPNVMPLQYCQSFIYIWAVGGKMMLFPENVGYAINDVGSEVEYLVLEIHIDNPGKLANVTFESGITIYHTSEPREHEAAMMIVQHTVDSTHIIPPKSENYTTVGHCSSNCTAERIKVSGIHLFNVLLHSHKAGRKLKLRHFRNGVELPWIANDDHYNFDFQQSRPLREEVVIYPGDQMSYECTCDTSSRDVVTLGGFSTRHEMCQVMIWYYPRQPLSLCGSYYYEMEKLFAQFGIGDVTWEYDMFDPTVLSPPEHANKKFSDVLNEYGWTAENKAVLEEQLRFSNHHGVCYDTEGGQKFIKNSKDVGILEPWDGRLIKYPELDEKYSPPQLCKKDTPSGSSSRFMPTSIVILLSGIAAVFIMFSKVK